MYMEVLQFSQQEAFHQYDSFISLWRGENTKEVVIILENMLLLAFCSHKMPYGVIYQNVLEILNSV